MTHQKRLAAPSTWKIKRKGKSRWIMAKRAGAHNIKYSMPLAVILREMLGVVGKAREAVKIVNQKTIMLNGKVETNYRASVGLMDVLGIPKLNKTYVMWLDDHGRLMLKDTKQQAYRLSRVEDKRTIDKKSTQLNLFGGFNALVAKDEFKTGDVVKIGLGDGKIAGKIDQRPGAEVLIIAGSHKGETAKITDMKGHDVTLASGKETFQTRRDCVYCIEGGLHGTKAQ